MEQVAPARPDGSALCLACGMCCRGVLHGWARLEAGEEPAASAAGLDVFVGEQGPAFRLPCPRLAGTACEIYGHRPSTCSGYRCRLLDQYLDGEVTLDGAQALVARARDQEDEISSLSGGVAFPELRRRWRLGLGAFTPGKERSAAEGQRLYLLVSALCDFLDRHFVLAREGSLTIASPPLEKTADRA